jgi:hypothetical protein
VVEALTSERIPINTLLRRCRRTGFPPPDGGLLGAVDAETVHESVLDVAARDRPALSDRDQLIFYTDR